MRLAKLDTNMLKHVMFLSDFYPTDQLQQVDNMKVLWKEEKIKKKKKKKCYTVYLTKSVAPEKQNFCYASQTQFWTFTWTKFR